MRLIQTVAAGVFVAGGMLAGPGGASAQERVTVVACVVGELDYLGAPAPAAPRGAAAQFVLLDAQSGELHYSLAGTREAELAAHVGRRVEFTGTVERARTVPVLTTADGARAGSVRTGGAGTAGVTPDGAAAHEPSDALAATVPAGAVAEAARPASNRADLLATLPRLNAASFRPVPGICVMPPPPAVASAAAAAPAPRSPQSTPAARTPESVTVRGCLARRTPEGTALTPGRDGRELLVLTDASLAGPRSPGVLGAVPGSVPSSSGSGTVPEPVGTRGRASGAAPLAFALAPSSNGLRELSRHVGERVEIVGTVDGDVPAAPADTAHPSATTRVIAVTSYRALGGTCN